MALDSRLRGGDDSGAGLVSTFQTTAGRPDPYDPQAPLELADSVTLVAHVSKGTYIRSLARDIARALGTLGHVTYLRRIKAGPFTLDHAISLDKLADFGNARTLEHNLLPLRAGLDDIPALHISDEEAKMFCHGQAINKKISSDYIPNGSDVLVKNRERSLGIAVFFEESLKPKRVFSNFIN